MSFSLQPGIHMSEAPTIRIVTKAVEVPVEVRVPVVERVEVIKTIEVQVPYRVEVPVEIVKEKIVERIIVKRDLADFKSRELAQALWTRLKTWLIRTVNRISWRRP